MENPALPVPHQGARFRKSTNFLSAQCIQEWLTWVSVSPAPKAWHDQSLT